MSEGGGDLFQHFAERNVNRGERENLSSTRLCRGTRVSFGFSFGLNGYSKVDFLCGVNLMKIYHFRGRGCQFLIEEI